jgi:hypothetical protein
MIKSVFAIRYTLTSDWSVAPWQKTKKLLIEWKRLAKMLWRKQAVDTYFDFLKKSVSSFPTGGTEYMTCGRRAAHC